MQRDATGGKVRTDGFALSYDFGIVKPYFAWSQDKERGTVGNGKHLSHIDDALEKIGCREDREPGENASRLAALMAATVLCGELSLLAAQTNPGELMKAHLSIERKKTSSR